MTRRSRILLALGLLATACAPASSDEETWRWAVPDAFPLPVVPDDNPMNAAKVELGRHLFYDTRMSGNGTYSCASCHDQSKAFTDGRAQAEGSTGQTHLRNSMGLTNAAYPASYVWANPLLGRLEDQALGPMFGDSPIIELGLSSEAALEDALAGEPRYPDMFAEAFPDDPEITTHNAVYAVAAFERTLISGDSPFDRWFYGGDESAISQSAKRGFALFNGHPFECYHCHADFNFTDSSYFDGKPAQLQIFHNTGLYNIDGEGAYPEGNTGVHEVTGDPKDMGKFKAPSLRNIAVTGPYMHDGSIATLSEVLDHYAAGGRTIAEGPNAGDGSANPLKSPLLTGFELSDRNREDMLAFLESLTDDGFLTNPEFSDPW